MGNAFTVSADIAKEKLYGLTKPKEKVEQEQKENLVKQQPSSSGVQWAYQAGAQSQVATQAAIQNNGKVQRAEVQVKPSPEIVTPGSEDIAMLSTTVIVEEGSVTALEKSHKESLFKNFTKSLKERFETSLEKNYAGIFSHNRLLAKLSELKTGASIQVLAMLGVPAEEIDGIKSRVRGKLIDQNKINIAQVRYDYNLLQIVG